MSTVHRYTIKKTGNLHRSLCVGILTLPHSRKTKHGTSHIMKSYVDWFEDRGVRVLPIPYDTPHPESYFQMINGLFIPGTDKGYDVNNSALMKTVTRFFELSLQPDEYFPIWGTCFGFQLLLFLVGGFAHLKRHEADGYLPIQLTSAAPHSRMMQSISKKISMVQDHEYGISPEQFMKNAHLRRFYRILATAIDYNGKEYVAAIEGKYYPIYGVQGHPERHRRGRPFLDFFISELKQNSHRATHPFMRSMYTPQMCSQYNNPFVLCYYF